MFQEAAAAPEVVRQQIEANSERLLRLGERLRELNPRAVVTCARGSSDNAATFARYLIETRLHVLTSSAAPSISSVYQAAPNLAGTLFLAISQSGASPDLLAAVRAARAAGALVVALVNAESSPLAHTADFTIPLCAGIERSVAATKSYIASLAAIIQLVGCWACDGAPLLKALATAPPLLERAWQLDWNCAVAYLRSVTDLYVIGRGLGLGMAQEAALKLKETCGLHAEAISSAEVRHGPMALVRPGFPVLVFTQRDETRSGVEALAAELAARADVMIAGSSVPGALNLPAEAADPVIEPMLITQSFYRMANALALARGHDPDQPPHLHKVTETV